MRIGSGDATNQDDVRITALPDGGWITTWLSPSTIENSVYDVWMMRYDANGTPVAPEALVNTTIDDRQGFAEVTGLPDGGWVVTWGNCHGSNIEVFQQRYGADGGMIGDETRIGDHPFGWPTDVAALPDGGWLVAWTARATPGEGTGNYVQRFDQTGTPVGGITRINTFSDGLYGTIGDPRLIVLADGGWVAAWHISQHDTPYSNGVYMQRFAADGSPTGAETLVNTTVQGHQANPALVALPDGGWLVVWDSETNIGGDLNVMGQRYLANGRAIGGETQLNVYTPGVQIRPVLAILTDGSVVGVWQSDIFNEYGYRIDSEIVQAGVILTPSYGGDTGDDTVLAPDAASALFGFEGNDLLVGSAAADRLFGGTGSDRLFGGADADTLHGGDGNDTLNGGAGDDFIFGGSVSADLRDVIYGGDGNDSIDGGHGNDDLNGGNGNDTLSGGFGSDTMIGNDGNDVLAGSGGSDLMFGNAGNDTLNGGFGFDRMNGGAGADSFFHAGVADHGSDWIQDYNAAEGDVLTVGLAGATRAQFQVNTTFTTGAGSAEVQEAFVIYRPTGQILWALVDGASQFSINLQIGGQVFDLLA